LWHADTAVMKSLAKDNDGYAYFVVAIDVVSRFAHTFALRSTQGKEMSSALQTLFRRGKKKNHHAENRQWRRVPEQRGPTPLEDRESGPLLHTERTQRAIKTIKSKLSRYMFRHQTHR
jgi:hypothetical protein